MKNYPPLNERELDRFFRVVVMAVVAIGCLVSVVWILRDYAFRNGPLWSLTDASPR